jgi:hypothetical protein
MGVRFASFEQLDGARSGSPAHQNGVRPESKTDISFTKGQKIISPGWPFGPSKGPLQGPSPGLHRFEAGCPPKSLKLTLQSLEARVGIGPPPSTVVEKIVFSLHQIVLILYTRTVTNNIRDHDGDSSPLCMNQEQGTPMKSFNPPGRKSTPLRHSEFRSARRPISHPFPRHTVAHGSHNPGTFRSLHHACWKKHSERSRAASSGPNSSFICSTTPEHTLAHASLIPYRETVRAIPALLGRSRRPSLRPPRLCGGSRISPSPTHANPGALWNSTHASPSRTRIPVVTLSSPSSPGDSTFDFRVFGLFRGHFPLPGAVSCAFVRLGWPSLVFRPSEFPNPQSAIASALHTRTHGTTRQLRKDNCPRVAPLMGFGSLFPPCAHVQSRVPVRSCAASCASDPQSAIDNPQSLQPSVNSPFTHLNVNKFRRSVVYLATPKLGAGLY